MIVYFFLYKILRWHKIKKKLTKKRRDYIIKLRKVDNCRKIYNGRVIMDIEGSSKMNMFINGYGANVYRRTINSHSC